jgi:hypothetical protein
MGSNHIDTQSVVIQILPLAMPKVVLVTQGDLITMGWPSITLDTAKQQVSQLTRLGKCAVEQQIPSFHLDTL